MQNILSAKEKFGWYERKLHIGCEKKTLSKRTGRKSPVY